MGKLFYPDQYCESVFTIDFDKLFELGYKGIIFDIDNTLVPHGKDSTDEVDNLFKRIHNIGFKTLLLSNNDEQRVKRFIKNIDTLYVCDAKKPKKEGYLKAINKLELPNDQIICIGDQVFTDVFGANKVKLSCILVKYIGFYKIERKGIRRNFETRILKCYSSSKKYYNRLGNIEKEAAYED